MVYDNGIRPKGNQMLDPTPDLAIVLTLGIAFGVPWLLGRAWTFDKKYDWKTFLLPIMLQIIVLVIGKNDTALIDAYQIDGGATLPYGRLWFILNPFYATEWTYLLFIFAWNMAFLGIMGFLVQHGKLSAKWVFWSEMLNVSLMLIHNPQSIVPMTFVYLAPAFTPLALVLAGIIKLPLDWSFPIWANRHFQCAFGSQAPSGVPYWECLHFQLDYFLISSDAWYNYFVYAILAAWIAWSLKLWVKKVKRVKN